MYPCNSEPSVEELLTDPVGRLLMARGGLQTEEVHSLVGIAKQKWAAEKALAHRRLRAPAAAAAQ